MHKTVTPSRRHDGDPAPPSASEESVPAPGSIAVIGVPSSVGARRVGQEQGPGALRAAGLLDALRALGLDVVDLGDLPMRSYRADSDSPRYQNAGPALGVGRQVAAIVAQALGQERFPVVLGGDCSITLGVAAGVASHRAGAGLVYFDGDLDLNTPETTPSGVIDGMVLAHLLGRVVPSRGLDRAWIPVIPENRIAVFGYDDGSGWIDPPELEILSRSAIAQFPAALVREDAAAAARTALGAFDERGEAFFVHFDVDVTNIASADVPHPRGLGPRQAFDALAVLLRSPACLALVVTEFNATRDPDGLEARLLAGGLASALRSRVGGSIGDRSTV